MKYNYIQMKNNTDNFEVYDKRGKELLKKWAEKQEDFKFIKNTGTKETYDTLLFYPTSDTLYVCETKIRFCNSNYYKTWMLQEDKRQELYAHCASFRKTNTYTNVVPVYVNFFNDKKMAVWNLDKYFFEDDGNYQLVSRTTMGDTSLVNKKVHYLDYAQAKIYDVKFLYDAAD